MDELDELDQDPDFYEYEFELINTDDPATLILICVASRELSPKDYAEALMAYAQKIYETTSLNGIEKNTSH